MFESVEMVKDCLEGEQYIATDEIATAVFLATKLNKPLLLEGPAGVGKTELSKAVGKATAHDLVRLQCYEGLDEGKALYEWEYAKQMLYTQLLRDKLGDLLSSADSLSDAADKLAAEEDVFFSERFLLPRPLMRALTNERPTVLLIDEIDRADAEFEAFLLEVLSDFQVSIPEIGTIVAKQQPIVFLTSNNTRELSEALKRRCLYLYIDYPNVAEELRIVQMKVPELSPELAKQAVEAVQNLRRMDLKKNPSVSETLDWARALVTLNAKTLDRETLEHTLTVLLKYESDVARAKRILRGGGTPGQQRPQQGGKDW